MSEIGIRVPKNITIETTSRCNLRCKYCPSTYKGAPHQDMDVDYFKSIIDRINFETIVVPYANGEPLLHPHISEMIKYVIDREHLVYLTTNGTIWNQELFEMVLEDNSYYQTIFSLDGIWDKRSRSIEIARPGSDREKIKKNIEMFLELKEKKNSKTDVAVKICKRGQDFEEVEEYIAYWLKLVDFVIVGEALVEHRSGGMRLHPCQYSDDIFMMIRWDGSMVLCMYNDFIINKGYLPLGKLDKTIPLLEAYNNESYTKFREDQRNGIFPFPCCDCGFPYSGSGFRGVVFFRDKKYGFGKEPIYYHRDYYNSFYSLKDKQRSDDYYGYNLGDKKIVQKMTAQGLAYKE